MFLSMFLMFFIKVKKHVFYVFLQINVFNIYGRYDHVFRELSQRWWQLFRSSQLLWCVPGWRLLRLRACKYLGNYGR